MAGTAPNFQQITTLKGHTSNINNISFSLDGKYMASGGDDGLLIVFVVKSWKMYKKYEVVDPIRAIAWHKDRRPVISVGTREGIILTINLDNDVHYEQSVPGKIHCMAFNGKGKLLAVAYHDEVVLVHQSTISKWGSQRHLVRPPNFDGAPDVALSVQFGGDKTLVAGYLYHGIDGYEVEDTGNPRALWHVQTDGLCAESALSPSARFLAAPVLFQGIQWYDMYNKGKHVFAHPTDAALDKILPIVFVGANTVAVGSSTGQVRIFKVQKPKAIETLRHNDDVFIQALGYFEGGGNRFLATGVSQEFDETVITIWRSSVPKKKRVVPWRGISLALGTAATGVLVAKHSGTIASILSGLPISVSWNPRQLHTGVHETVLPQIVTQTELHTQVVTQTVVTQTVELTTRVVPTDALSVHAHVHKTGPLLEYRDEVEVTTRID